MTLGKTKFKQISVSDFLKSFTLITTYIEATSYPILSLVVSLYNKLLNLLEDVKVDRSNHQLIRKDTAAGLHKLPNYYDKASPIVIGPRCKLEYFENHGWNCGGENENAFTQLDTDNVDLMSSRVKPAIDLMWKSYNLPSDSQTTIDGDPKDASSISKSRTDHSFIAGIISAKTTESKTDELKQYVNEETEPSNCNLSDILSYWAQRRNYCDDTEREVLLSSYVGSFLQKDREKAADKPVTKPDAPRLVAPQHTASILCLLRAHLGKSGMLACGRKIFECEDFMTRTNRQRLELLFAQHHCFGFSCHCSWLGI
ncbi:hypothetical protein OUZ56_009680 [Daphnia magna]|uniref:Uncharacterized protein n=1 Tax=Daphnia magna TaxID=35525 RepID=A0ABR0AGN7_9CRUS|nr:hypothetical protein OUZ56_009680 [Daphnia magna]